jgi:cytoskeletal protein CcmA (bactofilin family)
MPGQTERGDLKARGPASSLGKSIVLKGQILSREDLFLDGRVEGRLDLPGKRLTVGRNGNVQADIKARDAVVVGEVRGNLELDGKLTLRNEATLIGDLKTSSITIEDGAYFKGSVDIVRPNTGAPAASAGPPVRTGAEIPPNREPER